MARVVAGNIPDILWGIQFRGWLSHHRRSGVVLDNFVLTSEIAFQGRFEKHRRPTIEYEPESFGIREQAARVPSKGMCIVLTVYTDLCGLVGGFQPMIHPYAFQPPVPEPCNLFNLTDAFPLGL